MTKRKTKGFTLVELMVGLTLGVIVLTGLLAFFFRTSKMINTEQNQVKNLSQLQFVMNKMVEDIKEANTQAPGVGNTTVNQGFWASLPHLPYGRTYSSVITEPPDELPRIIPSYPLAYNFANQAGLTGTYHGWTPRPSENRSNELVFYKVSGNDVIRILYYLENNEIIREEQKPIESDSRDFKDDDLQRSKTTILREVKELQFTYPRLEAAIEDAGFQAQLNAITSGNIPHSQNMLMNEYRDSINIRVVTYGAEISKGKKATGLELTTEVKIRN